MNTNEISSKAPKNIYLTKNLLGELRDGWDALPSEGFTNIEYIRKDAFIEKVINFLEILGYAYTITDNITKSLYDNTQLIEDFKNYMEE